MASAEKPKAGSKKVSRKDRAAEVANTFEWLITAFVLAFLFRAFVMEAFRIPTGSMADTLKGAHFRLRCVQCGYRYDYGLGNFRLPRDTLPRRPLKPMPSRCPSCGYYYPTGAIGALANGDRILVLKCIYQFLEPRQWDVVVFKNPLNPSENYIKRLIGRPGQAVEIIDGDIYIDGAISRKPPKVQDELWMVVYDNDYQPVRPRQGPFNTESWEQPFKSVAGSQWQVDAAEPTRFSLSGAGQDVHTMIYDTSAGNDFKTTYAYDDVRDYSNMPYCSDLMVRFYAARGEGPGRVGIAMSKYETRYEAWVDSSGQMVITKAAGDGPAEELARRGIDMDGERGPSLVKFSNVDHELIFQFGAEVLTYDLGTSPGDAGERKTDIQPQVKIFGSGAMTLSHVAIFRDIHYTEKKYANSYETGRAVEGNPLRLEADEFFVLGDNSPNSEDGRWWSTPGKGNNGVSYRAGIVPRDYLVGKAMFVYWPSGFRPDPRFPFGIIPNVGQMRFIYGGSGQSP
ncbi:MAG TPA: signal peptidase I [Sedimentisphaerales bacterium]|nr:signal peptidase I [Sedimentisphaerales bacterium]